MKAKVSAEVKKIRKLSDLSQDNRNANRGTKRGTKLLRQSLEKCGAGRSIVVDRDGRIIAGNQVVKGAANLGMKDVLVVRSDGSKVVVVQRTDLSLDDAKARELAISDNRVGELNLDWDFDVLNSFKTDIDLAKVFDDDRFGTLEIEPKESENEIGEGFGVLIEKLTEQQQIALLQKLSGEGYTVKAITF